MKGILISFEGTDGCGKSTQIRLLEEYLIKKGKKVVVSREPGGCKIGENIRNILLDAKNSEMDPVCELFLYEAARAQHMAQTVLPALNDGCVVILDRFIDSTVAYQGYGRQLGGETVDILNKIAIGEKMPDITFLLEISPKAAFERKGGNDANDRMELAGNEFFFRVREGFKAVAEKDKKRIKVIDASGTRSETHRKIVSATEELFNER